LKVRTFKLTGGEPLLHPEILACLDVARASGIADAVSVTTNGLLLERMPDRFFESVDRLTLSWYPAVPLSAEAVARVERRCRAHDVTLGVKRIDSFGRMDPERPLSDSEARRVHAACWLRVRCHLLHEGHFYACTRPPHLALARGEPALASRDGVELDDDAVALLRRLRLYLEAETPLESCRACLGASGPREPHAQERATA
jgi:cyclic pyranopterin phosphate synthase